MTRGSKANNSHFVGWKTETLIMSNSMRWKLAALLHVASAVSLFPQTLLIETRDEVPRQAMGMRQRIRITSLETGIMDTLFDEGYIVFDRILTRGDKSATVMNREASEFAAEQDADLLLVLVPDGQGASWSLVEVGHAGKVAEGFADISVIERDGNVMKRWISLGGFLAASVLSVLDEAKLGDAGLRRRERIRRYQ